MRQRVSAAPRPRRTLDERLLVGVPGLMSLARWIHGRLAPARRRFLLQRGMESQFRAINRRDFDLFVSRCHPDVVFDVAQMGSEGLLLDYDEAYRGHDGVRRFFGQWVEWWGEYHVDLEELIYLDDGRVVVALGSQRGRARLSGAEVTQPLAFVVTFDKARAVHIRAFWSPAQALESVGL